MAFCTKCGSKLGEGVKFCPSCGAPVEGNTYQQQTNQQYSQPNGQASQANVTQPVIQFDPADVEQNRMITIFSYLWFLFFIPLVTAPTSRFARFHANQGLVLFLCEVALGVANAIIGLIFGLIGLGVIGSVLAILIFAAEVLFITVGILHVCNGTSEELPIIGGIKILK